ncbi:hypothetical protein [Natronoglomus mannanivorans]|uniref:PepSY domain-containing protein n=1 Tax=Natronoglomus mannanivorans TaxID=2979990 RepID=A0AAP2Z3W4_9EURY|nr:hypothetical protein [Halobacteria archaeon AArc-xg1-1]
MTGKHTERTAAENRVTTKEAAGVTAYDALADAGYTSIVTTTPHQTRGTWIVPATSTEGSWRVHIDPRTGSTRIVQVQS